jgi:hypothetical protein
VTNSDLNKAEGAATAIGVRGKTVMPGISSHFPQAPSPVRPVKETKPSLLVANAVNNPDVYAVTGDPGAALKSGPLAGFTWDQPPKPSSGFPEIV